MTGSYLVNCRSLASMLRCLIHILVRAEPISLVAPARKTQPGLDWHTLIGAFKHLTSHIPYKVLFIIPQITDLTLGFAWKLLACCENLIKTRGFSKDEQLHFFCFPLHSANIYTRKQSASWRDYTHSQIKHCLMSERLHSKTQFHVQQTCCCKHWSILRQ